MTWFALRTRAALGLTPTLVPVSLYVPLGFLLGPRVLNVLSYDVLAHLDGVVSVALATLGVFVGIALAREVRESRRLIAAATIESGITILVVTFAIWFLLVRWQAPLDTGAGLIALVLGVAAAASSAGAADTASAPTDPIASRVADLDDVVPIVVGAAALALVGTTTPGVEWDLLEGIGAGVSAALVGGLLFEHAEGMGERGVFVLGTLTLLGGMCAYLAVSPLLAGLVCGALWRLSPGRADEIIAEDLRKYHHPLILLLLVYAGALMQFVPAALWLFAPFVLFRLSGKLIGGWTAATLYPATAADTIGAYLVPPGVIGLAVALNFNQVTRADGTLVLTAVAAGAVAFEVIAMIVSRPSEAAR